MPFNFGLLIMIFETLTCTRKKTVLTCQIRPLLFSTCRVLWKVRHHLKRILIAITFDNIFILCFMFVALSIEDIVLKTFIIDCFALKYFLNVKNTDFFFFFFISEFCLIRRHQAFPISSLSKIYAYSPSVLRIYFELFGKLYTGIFSNHVPLFRNITIVFYNFATA